MEVPNSLGIFIFYHKPDIKYTETLCSFLELSLGLKQTFFYALTDYAELGLYEIVENLIERLKPFIQTKFHSIMIYIENTLLDETSANFCKDETWFKFFDIYQCYYVIFLYKDSLAFQQPPPLFKYELIPSSNEIIVKNQVTEACLVNRTIIIDNYNIEEFCFNILTVEKEMDIYQFLIGRRFEENRSIVHCNFTPSNLINLFYNYRYKSIIKVNDLDIIPVYSGAVSLRLLNILYRELKACQKRRLITFI